MNAQVSVDLLNHTVGHLGAQHEPGSALMGLEFIEGGFDLPSLGVQPCQFVGGGSIGIGDGGQQPVGPVRLGADVAGREGVPTTRTAMASVWFRRAFVPG